MTGGWRSARFLTLTATRLTAVSAFVVVACLALTSPGQAMEVIPWDKAAHALAFYALTLLSVAAAPRAPIWIIVVGLMVFGAGIEAAQGFTGRDADWRDLAADAAGVLAALAPLCLRRTRDWMAGRD